MINKININDQVTVILTEFGQKILKEYRENLEKKSNLKFESILSCDENGKYTTELWNLMNLFGQYMKMGQEQIFLHNKIYLD